MDDFVCGIWVRVFGGWVKMVEVVGVDFVLGYLFLFLNEVLVNYLVDGGF